MPTQVRRPAEVALVATWWGVTIGVVLLLAFLVAAAWSGRRGPLSEKPRWWVMPAIYLSLIAVTVLASCLSW